MISEVHLCRWTALCIFLDISLLKGIIEVVFYLKTEYLIAMSFSEHHLWTHHQAKIMGLIYKSFNVNICVINYIIHRWYWEFFPGNSTQLWLSQALIIV